MTVAIIVAGYYRFQTDIHSKLFDKAVRQVNQIRSSTQKNGRLQKRKSVEFKWRKSKWHEHV